GPMNAAVLVPNPAMGAPGANSSIDVIRNKESPYLLALPAFEWAKARAEVPRNLRNARGIRLFSSPGGDKGSVLRRERRWPSSDDPDSGNHRRFFNGLNLRVEPLAGGVGDPMVEVRQDVVQVLPDHPRHLHDRWQPRMRRPEVPVPPMPQGPAL